MPKIFYTTIIFLLSSCSNFKGYFNSNRSDLENKIIKYKNNDYIEQLQFLGEEYLKYSGIKKIRLSSRSRSYLNTIYRKIVRNSELILDDFKKPNFYIIKDSRPFYFSLPGQKFFFSSGLIVNFFKNEQLLVATLAHEIVKSQKNIYLKNAIVPIGYISTERIIALTKVPLEIKMEINKWTFYTLGRAGYDSTAYLNWLQTQNKNTIDFTFQLGSGKQISREEFLFKNFIVKQGLLDEKEINRTALNSSSAFYRLVNEIGRNRI